MLFKFDVPELVKYRLRRTEILPAVADGMHLIAYVTLH